VAAAARPHHLAVRGIAEVEAVGAMPAPVRQRERPDRDCQRFERRGPAVTRGFSCQHARDVGFERKGLDRVPASGARDADADFALNILCLGR
jgi:hypothetical protein